MLFGEVTYAILVGILLGSVYVLPATFVCLVFAEM